MFAVVGGATSYGEVTTEVAVVGVTGAATCG